MVSRFVPVVVRNGGGEPASPPPEVVDGADAETVVAGGELPTEAAEEPAEADAVDGFGPGWVGVEAAELGAVTLGRWLEGRVLFSLAAKLGVTWAGALVGSRTVPAISVGWPVSLPVLMAITPTPVSIAQAAAKPRAGASRGDTVGILP